MDFLDELQAHILPADGAMGTELLATGLPLGACLEELTVRDPERIRRIHQSYLAAGARLLRTNTFGANAARLAPHGFEHRVGELNWSAAQLARDVARGTGVYVAGSVGPLGAPRADAHDIFTAQIGALLDGGAQLILFETFRDVDELLIALAAKQALHHCPAICMMALEDPGEVAAAFAKLRAAEADVLGLNCLDPATIDRLLADKSHETCAAFPSAGLPTAKGYPVTPLEFATAALALSEKGVRLLGGCCGIGPAHLAAFTAALPPRP